MELQTTKETIPAIGEQWPGLDAIYAGVALSQTEDKLVHLVLWNTAPEDGMSHDKAVAWAEGVNPDMSSHLPTRHQSITLFDRVRDRLNIDYWHWTLTKTKDGKAAFRQIFGYGDQHYGDLSWEGRVRAVSEIPL